MSNNKPIHLIAKELCVDSSRIILACKSLGIYAKGSSKRLNIDEYTKVKNYFENGKNVSEETVEIKNQNETKTNKKIEITNEKINPKVFPNRLIG